MPQFLSLNGPGPRGSFLAVCDLVDRKDILKEQGSVDNTQDITVLSLCAGYGGLELGLARALANPLRVVAVEIEAYALANLVSKAEESRLAIEALWPDLRTFPAERFRGCFDFILAGYPCQPFSVAGKRQGADDPRHLWPAIARIVSAVEPLWCFFENVPGHLSLGFPDVYCSLRDMGYKVEAGLFTAAEVGAPHKRERLFILAHRQSERDLSIQQQGQRRGLKPGGKAMADAETTERRGVSEKHTGWGFKKVGGYDGMWPARPGQPQYEWEEPRVVGNAGSRRCEQSQGELQTGRNPVDETGTVGDARSGTPKGLSQPEGRNLDRENRDASGQRQAQSRLGRAVDGTANRVDRLRLLGNGVVPQQEEKAFRALYEQIVAL